MGKIVEYVVDIFNNIIIKRNSIVIVLIYIIVYIKVKNFIFIYSKIFVVNKNIFIKVMIECIGLLNSVGVKVKINIKNINKIYKNNIK